MKYVSTRGQVEPHGFSEAVRIGLAPDGGLFVPQELPDLSPEMPKWEGLSYPETCYEFLRHFATDIEGQELRDLIEAAYASFDHPEHAPLVELGDGLRLLELFHGPTLAFKDFALQLLGGLYERQVRLSGQPINVLGATSGDTGAAAISGLLGKENVNIFILYPEGRVAPLQERQMACTGAENVFPLAIRGSFDDAQAALKEVFGDKAFSQQVGLSAVNSINLVRILGQCVYYIHAWLRLPRDERSKTTFVVPTGNFGNVLSGWLACRMGMQVAGFRVATNQNDILYRFFSAGDYSVDEVRPSLAPSMDIQVASNFERYLYYGCGEDASRARAIMEAFKRDKAYRFDDEGLRSLMSSSRMEDGEIEQTIRRVYEQSGYILDPHTACGFKDLEALPSPLALATAHPAKFPEAVERATGQRCQHPRLEALKQLPIVNYRIAPDADSIRSFIASKI